MTPGTAKRKGRETENRLVEWLHAHGWPYTERRRLAGTADRGDISGVIGVTIEVKSGARLDIAGWMKELEVEMVNDRADLGLVVVRPKGCPDPEAWWAVMPVPIAFKMLRERDEGTSG